MPIRDEKVIEIRQTIDGEETVFYSIRDQNTGYWKVGKELNLDFTWTRDHRLRAEFDNYFDALDALVICTYPFDVDLDVSENEVNTEAAA